MKKVFLLLALALGIAGANAQIIKSGDITANETWTNDNIYILSGFVYVKSPAVLTIEEGTVIKGDFATKGALIVERDAKIIANGTAEQPIVFTSQKAVGQRAYGDWGGLIICGKASVNQPANGGLGTNQGEAIVEGGVGTIYGGGTTPDDSDSSGAIRYVRIEFGGIPFQPNSEINGLTLCGVGSKTVIEHVQISYGGDDAFEWFGGTVNNKYLISYRNWDDDFDTDFGFSGNIQFGLVVRDPAIADQSGSNGFESDNDATGTTNTPNTSPNFSNVTVVGPYALNSTINNLYRRALHLRRNTRTSTYNSVFMGYPTGLLIESSSTQTNATNNDLQFRNTVLAQIDDTLAATTSANPNNTNGAFDISAWFATAGWDNNTVNTVAELQFKKVSLTSPDFSLNGNSPLLTGASFNNPRLQNSFFTQTAYRGAFGTSNWTSCWAEFDPQNQAYNGALDYSVTATIAPAGSTTICQGETVTLNTTTNATGASYLWSNGATTSSIDASASGAYTVTVTSARGCTKVSAPVSVTVNTNPAAPVITPNGPTSFCTGGSVQLSSSYASGNVWSTAETTQAIMVSTSGTFTVTHTDGNGCASTSSAVTTSVGSAPKPTISITGDVEFCQGGDVVLTASESDSYMWNNNATTRSITVSASGNYTVSVTNADACDGTGTSDAVTVTAHSNPSANATYAEDGLEVTFTNSSTGGSSYIWDFGDNGFSILEDPSHTYDAPGTYDVTLIVENANDCSDTTTWSVAVDFGTAIRETELFGSINLFPNPSTGVATLNIALNEQSDIEVRVSDITGKVIVRNAEERLAAGNHSTRIDMSNVSDGFYFVTILANGNAVTKRLVINR